MYSETPYVYIMAGLYQTSLGFATVLKLLQLIMPTWGGPFAHNAIRDMTASANKYVPMWQQNPTFNHSQKKHFLLPLPTQIMMHDLSYTLVC